MFKRGGEWGSQTHVKRLCCKYFIILKGFLATWNWHKRVGIKVDSLHYWFGRTSLNRTCTFITQCLKMCSQLLFGGTWWSWQIFSNICDIGYCLGWYQILHIFFQICIKYCILFRLLEKRQGIVHTSLLELSAGANVVKIIPKEKEIMTEVEAVKSY